MPDQSANRPATTKCLRRIRLPPSQHGVVLIISLILLVVISLLAVTSMRNAGSSESVATHVRTTELATEAAEIALRHCESSVLKLMGGEAPYTTTLADINILTMPATTPKWQVMSIWDSTSTATFVLPLDLVNQAGMVKTYNRPPECMVERQPVLLEGSNVVNTTSSFVITARGFGPEVAPADSVRSRPQGSEAWLQSHIEIK